MGKGLRIAEPSLSGAVGAAVGLVGGPPGVVVGGVVGGLFSTAVKKLCFEMDNRFMGPREQARLGAVCALGAAEIVERIKAGEKLREDGFFVDGDGDRSRAEEVWESLLSKCQREASERKLPYMGHLFANLAFDETVGLDMAHQIISAAEQLSYRQLCILRICAVPREFNVQARFSSGDGKPAIPNNRSLYPILSECLDLANRGFIRGERLDSGAPFFQPGTMRIEDIGDDIHDLMNLEEIPNDDLNEMVERFVRY